MGQNVADDMGPVYDAHAGGWVFLRGRGAPGLHRVSPTMTHAEATAVSGPSADNPTPQWLAIVQAVRPDVHAWILAQPPEGQRIPVEDFRASAQRTVPRLPPAT